MITFDCPHCLHTLNVPEHLAGRTGTCNHCRGVVTVPELPGTPQAAPPPGRIDPLEFGAYGKAADARWVDPTEEAARALEHEPEPEAELPEIPYEVLQRHKQMKRRQTMQFVGYGLAALVVALLLAPLIYAVIMRKPEPAPGRAEPAAVAAPQTPTIPAATE